MKFKIKERDGRFRVYRRFLGWWFLFTYGINQGGGSNYIEADSLEKAEEILKKEIDHIRKERIGFFGWKTVKELEL